LDARTSERAEKSVKKLIRMGLERINAEYPLQLAAPNPRIIFELCGINAAIGRSRST
jgi:hypothetical protein